MTLDAFRSRAIAAIFLRVKDLHEAAMPLSLVLWKLVVRHLFFVALSASDLRAGIFFTSARPLASIFASMCTRRRVRRQERLPAPARSQASLRVASDVYDDV